MSTQHAPTLLVIDAEARLRRLFGLALRREGYAVHTVTGGCKAVQTLMKMPVDLVLLKTPTVGLDSVSLCAALRKTSTVPILVLSNLADNQHVVNTLEAGADDVLCKPFDRLELLVRIDTLLRRVAWQTQSFVHCHQFRPAFPV